MTYELFDPQPARRYPGWLRFVLIAGFLISLIIGVVALFLFYWLGQGEGDGVQPAGAQAEWVITAQGIPPHLALLELGGADAAPLARQAANAGERHLAHAILRLGADLPQGQQARDLTRVAILSADAGEVTQALDGLRAGRAVAITAANIPPLERGQILAQIAQGLARLGQTQEAVETALQAQHVAVQTPELLPAQRVQILEGVAGLLRQHGSPDLQRQLQELLRNPSLNLNLLPPAGIWFTVRESVPLSLELTEAISLRQQAADRLRDRLLVAATADIEPERQALRAALSVEDQARAQRYAQVNSPDLTLAQQHELIQGQRVWILTKLRIAQGGFGLDLMPEWAAQTDALLLALTQVTNNLVLVVEQQIATQADPVAGLTLRAEALTWLAGQSDLGFYPAAPLGDLATRLQESHQLLRQNSLPPAFPVLYDLNATPPGFRIGRVY
jgi:hypothetical protein